MEWMTAIDAAAALEVDPSHIRRLAGRGDLVGRRRGRDWEIDAESVEAYKKRDRKRGPKPKPKDK